jgi:hypothetical protein
MLFILAMEPLQKMMEIAASDGLLSPLTNWGAPFRVSLYADDAAVFVFFWNELWGKAPQQQNILIKEGDPTDLQSTSKEENT